MTFAETIVSTSPANFWAGASAGIAFALFCFYRSFRALRHTRIIEDTATSKIRSAAQGYTEIEGIAELLEGEPIIAPLTGTRCVWYGVQVEERTSDSSGFGRFHFRFDGSWTDLLSWNRGGKGWSTIRKATSDAIFRIRDDTGSCIVDPEFALVEPVRIFTWYGDSPHPTHGPPSTRSLFTRLFDHSRYRYTEKRIHSDDPVYVIGSFVTIGGNHPDATTEAEIRDLLSGWKRDPSCLLERFDLNRDGRIDVREWEVARKAARKSVEQSRKTETIRPSTNLIRKPGDDQLPFILSAVPQPLLIERQRRIAGLCFIAFLASALITAWAAQIRFSPIF
ncbi:MAG: E3 ubiquitin ligase family protein [Methylococcaceae bacterium]|nr:E3 ubiquitin ligase family protein [Methylococcaceae bacterium]